MRKTWLLLALFPFLIVAAEYEARSQDSSGPISRPAPQNEVRLEKSRMVPMRDGV